MADKIRGLTIKLQADTSEFASNLRKLNSDISDTQKQLKDVNKVLKLDPKNVDLLRQKQELLTKAIDETNAKLKYLKETQSGMTNEYRSTEEGARAYDALSREIAETEEKLKSLKKESQDVGSILASQLQVAGQQLQEVGDKISGVGEKLSTSLTAPIVAVGAFGLTYNAKMEKFHALLTTLTGSAQEADSILSKLQEDAAKSPFDTASLVEANQYLLAAGINAEDSRVMINALGNAVAASGGGNAELQRMAQNLQQIQNTGKATTMDIRQFANAGINIYGLLSETLGYTVEELQNMDITYDMLYESFTMASSEGGRFFGAMEDQSQTLNGSLSTLKDNVASMVGSFTESLLPVIKDILDHVNNVILYLKELDPQTKEQIVKVGLLVAAIGPLLIIIGKVISVVGTVFLWAGKIISVVSTVVGVLGGPLTAAIAAVIAIGILLWKNWETVVSFAKNCWNSVKNIVSGVAQSISNTFNNMKNTVLGVFNNVWNTIKGIVDKIKNVFNFSWSLPKLKLPHLSITGSFSLVPPSVPKFSIQWYRKAMDNGMILNSPTIFGMNSRGQFLGAGEVGSETVVGTNSLMNMIREASGNGMTVNMTVNAPQGMDVNQLADLTIAKLNHQIAMVGGTWK